VLAGDPLSSSSESTIPANAALLAIIHRNFESKSLDYKAAISWEASDKKACCELVKDIIAMANTDGGYIVIGVSELGTGFRLDGLTSDQAKTFETSEICRFVQNYADPPVNVRVQKVTHDGKIFVVLEIPRFADTPHICQKMFPDVLRDRELYVRTDSNESAPIRSSSDFRALIDSAIRNRSDALLSSFRSILMRSEHRENYTPSTDELFQAQIDRARSEFDLKNPLKEKDYKHFAETVFRPINFDQYRFPGQDLEYAARHAHVDFVGWPFLLYPRNRSNLLSQTDDGLQFFICTSDFANQDILELWRLNESGLFFKRELTPNASSNPPETSAPRIIWQFAEAVFCLCRLYEKLVEDSEQIAFQFRLDGTRGRLLIWSEIGFRHPEYQANRPSIEVHASHSLAEWRVGLEDHALALSREVFAAFHLPDPDDSRIRAQIRKILQRRL
jgi:hypothetical protein